MSTSTRTIDQVFRVLRAQVPGSHPEITSDTVGVWLGRLSNYAEGTLIEAATTWGALQFPSLGDFVAHVDETARRIAMEEREARRRGDLDLDACPECGNADGWVMEPGLTRAGYSTPVRPCRSCNYVGWWLWNGGHLMPNHDCGLCRARRKNRKALTDAMARVPTESADAADTF